MSSHFLGSEPQKHLAALPPDASTNDIAQRLADLRDALNADLEGVMAVTRDEGNTYLTLNVFNDPLDKMQAKRFLDRFGFEYKEKDTGRHISYQMPAPDGEFIAALNRMSVTANRSGLRAIPGDGTPPLP